MLKVGETMPVSEAQKKAVTKYVKEKYDRIMLTMPKGKRDTIKEAANANKESTNAFILQAVDERIERLGGSVLEDGEDKQ